jgi:hypothetical protein
VKPERLGKAVANSSSVTSIVTLDVVSAGYSATALAAKIGVKEGQRVMLVGAARDWTLEGLPPKVRVIRRRGSSSQDVTIAFFTDATTLEREIADLSRSITPDGSLWIAWPRRAGGHQSNITDQVVRAAALSLGLVDVKVAALDDDWSALKTVWRKELRAKLR